MNKNFLQRVIISLLLIPLVIFCIHEGKNFFNIFLFLIFSLCFYEILKLKNFLSKLTLFFLLIFFVFSFYQLRVENDDVYNLYFIIFVTWLSDIGGYVFGKLIGGKKINFLSPNKTYSGFVGSIFFSLLILVYLQYFNLFSDYILAQKIGLIVLISSSVIIGDLFFSYIKRLNKIKDYSNLLPGHGGLLDRIDGLIFSVILFYLLFKI